MEYPPAPGTPVWDEAPALELPTLSGEHSADVCVVGLGGSGLAAVTELLRAGRSVVGLDAGSVAGGAAGRNGGFLLAGLASFYPMAIERHGHAKALALYRATLDEIDRMEAETPDLIRRPGSLRIAFSAAELADCSRQLAAMLGDGLPAHAYTGPEGEGLLFPQDGVFQPVARCRALARGALDAGAQLYEQSRVTDITRGSVTTPAGRIRCQSVVVAVDGRLEQLIPELAGTVRTARLQMLATGPAPEVDLPRPVYARYGKEYWQQLPDRRIALGGFRDLGGEAEWTDAAEPTAPIQAALERFLRDRLEVRAPVTHRWAASVGYTENGLPVVAEVRPGIWVAGGYSGTGNVVGALAGRAAAQAAIGVQSAFLDLLRQ